MTDATLDRARRYLELAAGSTTVVGREIATALIERTERMNRLEEALRERDRISADVERGIDEAARAEEREQCAIVCEAHALGEWSDDNFGIGKHAGCIECATRIRARGQAKADGSGA